VENTNMDIIYQIQQDYLYLLLLLLYILLLLNI